MEQGNETNAWHMAVCLLEVHLTRANRAETKKNKEINAGDS